MKNLLAFAVFLDAAVLFWILRGVTMEPNSARSLIVAAAVAMPFAVIAGSVIVNPTPRVASLARAVALIMIVGMLGVLFMTFLAANFESGVSGRDLGQVAALLFLGAALQALVFVTARSVDGRSLDHALGAAIPYGFALWFGGAALYFVVSFVLDFF